MNYIQEVKAAQKGSKDAFSSLIQQHEKVLYTVAKSILHNEADCCDAVQEAILKAYKNIRQLKQPEFFKSWLIKILVNSCNQLYRNKSRIVLFDGQQAEAVQGNENSYDEYSYVETRQVINSLDEDLKLVVILYYIEDLSVKSISKTLEIPEGTVKSRLSRARAQLNSMMNTEKGSLCYEQ